MSNDTTIKLSASQTVDHDKIRTEDKSLASGAKTPISLIDVGGSGTTESIIGDSGVAMPVAGLGSAGTAATGVVTVQGIASMTPIQIGDNSSSITVDNAGTFATQAAQSGTWTVQPGNTANTTAWLVTGTGGTFPATQSGTWNITNVSGTISLPTGASTLAEQQTQTTHLATLAGLVLTTQADDVANTADGLQTSSFLYVYDGSTWDRLRGTSADGMLVNLGTNNDVTVTGSVTANAGTNLNTSALALESGGNLAACATSLGTLDNIVSGSEAQVDIVAAIPAGDNAIGRVKLTDGTDVADVLDLTNSNPLTVAIVDGSGSQITSFGGGTQYTEGDTDASVTGTAVMWEDGSDTLRVASAAKPLPVNVVSGGGTGGTSSDFDAVFPGTGTAIGAHHDGDMKPLQLDASGRLYVALGTEIPAGTQNIGDVDVASVPADPFGVNADAASATGSISAKLRFIAATGIPITGIVPGTGATNLGKAIDTATGATDTGVLALATRDDALSSLTPAEGDNVQLRTDSTGALWANVATSALPSGGSTSAKQDTIIGHLDGVETVLGTIDADTSVMAAWNADSRCNVSLIDTQVGVQGAEGVITGKTLRVTIATDDDGVASLGLIDDAIVADDAGFTAATTKVMMAGFVADEASTDSVGEDDGGAARMTLDRKQIVTQYAHTTGGCSIFRSIDIDETEEEVKGTAGQVYGIFAMNRTAAPLYLKLYNATAASVSVGSTTPVMTLVVPGNGDSDGAGFSLPFPVGVVFDTAITVACTTAIADADTGAPGANDCVVHIFYK